MSGGNENPFAHRYDIDAVIVSIRNSGLSDKEKSEALDGLFARYENRLSRCLTLGGSQAEQLAIEGALDYLREMLSTVV